MARLASADRLSSESTDSAVSVALYRINAATISSPCAVALVPLLLDLVEEPPIRLPNAVESSHVVPLVLFPADPRFVTT